VSHIQTFTISGYEFRNVDAEDANLYDVQDLWIGLLSAATSHWRGDIDSLDALGSCSKDELFEVFAIFDPDGNPWGVWSLYRIKNVAQNTITTLCSPTFPSIAASIPEEVFIPGRSTAVNAAERAEALIVRERFWRQTFACIEAMLVTPMQMSDGTIRAIDHFRFPSVADGDPVQHEWRGVKDQFDRYCKIEVEFDENGTAVKTLPGWKEVDPDPDRPLGQFVA